MKAAVLSLALCATLGAHVQTLRTQIEATDRSLERLTRAKAVDALVKTIQAHVTSDFKYVEAGQTANFDRMAQGMRMGVGGMKAFTKVEWKLLALKESGPTATATTHHAMEGTILGGDKKTHLLAFEGTSSETYVKQAGGWKLARMAWIDQTMRVDGKPVPTGQGR